MKKLTNEEYNVLNKIATKSKMDCWFIIEQDKDGNDYILDNESGLPLSLEGGIAMLDSGITSLEDYDLMEEEKTTYINLMYKINAHFRNKISSERLQTLIYNALVLLEDDYGAVMGTDLEEELGITQKEYDIIMGGNNE